MDYDKKFHRNVEVGIKLAQPLGYLDYVNFHNKLHHAQQKVETHGEKKIWHNVTMWIMVTRHVPTCMKNLI